MVEKKEKNFLGIGVLFVGVIIVLLVGVIAGTMVNPSSIEVFSSETKEYRTINVSGTVTKNVSPDKAEIVLSAQTIDVSAQDSQSQNAVISEQIRNALKNIGLSDKSIQTVNYYVGEERQWNSKNGKYDIIGFRTTNTIKITLTDLSITGKVVDAAVSAGANDVSSIAFTLSDEKQLQMKNEALREASQAAKQKAQSITSSINVVLGQVKTINENAYYYTPNYVTYSAMEDSSMKSAETPINPSDVSVTATVNIEFELQ